MQVGATREVEVALKPQFKLTIRGDIPLKLVGDVDTFEDMR